MDAQKAEEDKQSYSSNLTLVTHSIISGAAKAEEVGNLIHSVWRNAIYEESDLKTDKYTKENGRFVDDFNDALGNLYVDEEFLALILEIQASQESVGDMMKSLQNPPEEYADAHEAISEMYDAYLSLTNLVTNPSGSLQTFTENFNTYDNEVVNCYNSMKLYIE